MPAIDSVTFVTDYEALRGAFLASQASPPATRLAIQRLIAEGLHAWLNSQPLARPGKTQRAPSPSPPGTTEVPGNEALVQLIASMTLGSLIFAEETA